MPRPFAITIGGPDLPFNRGLNTAKRPGELAPNEAVFAVGVDLSHGTLRGEWSPGTALSVTVATSHKFAWYVSEYEWISTAYPDWACNDSQTENGSGRTYRTARGASAATNPVYHQGNAAFQLGLDYTPAPPTVAAGARADNRSYAVTFYSTTTGFESNPTNRTGPFDVDGACLGVKSGATLSAIQVYPAATPDAGTIHRRIYATKEGDPNGTLYYYDTIEDNTATSWTDTGGDASSTAYEVDLTLDLDWGAGGNVDSTTTPFDHSPPVKLTCMAESFMGTDGAAGVLFGAIKSSVRWSHTGKPWAWPEVHQHDVQEFVEAIVIWQGQAFVFTSSSVWAFSGAADYAITPIKTGAAHGIKEGFGKSAKVTPWGILYAAREGIALFDGAGSRIITKGILDPEALYDGITYGNAAFYDGRYLFNPWGSGVVYALQMEAEGGLLVTQSAINPGDLHVTPHADAAIGQDEPGLYVTWRTSGDITPWRPADGAAVPGAARSSSWIWKTALLTLGNPARSKNFRRVRVSGSALSITFSVGDDLTLPSYATYTATFTKAVTGPYTEFWLPAGFIGKAMRVDVTANGAGAELHEITIEGDMLDA